MVMMMFLPTDNDNDDDGTRLCGCTPDYAAVGQKSDTSARDMIRLYILR